MESNSTQAYPMSFRAIHWIMAILIIIAYFVGDYMAELPKDADKTTVFSIHTKLGVLIGILILARIAMRLKQDLPEPIGEGIQLMAAKWTHAILYVILLLMPISGLIMTQAAGKAVSVLGLFDLPLLIEKSKPLHEAAEEVHESVQVVLLVLVILHIAAALYHHFYLKDETVKRMTKG